ncbi:hypothetical protein JW899_04380 [Candidatus Uhrbacteria bacterium]|nr:hypothetical protein [Candidatus Uhrbacteria bacterium]
MDYPPQNRPFSELPPTHLALYRRLATVFVIMTLAVAALVFYVVWAKATVIVLSRQEEIRAEFIADVSRQPRGGELSGTVLSLTDTATRTFPTAVVSRVEGHAEGRVRITSRLASPQTLVATTRLLDRNGMLFRIKDQVTVPALGSVEVGIFSDGTGPGNDIGDSTFTIPGLNPVLRERFSVETVEPVSGGVRDLRVVGNADFEVAVAQLKSDLVRDLTERMRKEALAGGLPVSGEAIQAVMSDRHSSPAVGEEAESFSVTVTVKAVGVFFDRNQLDRLAEAKVREIVPFGRRLAGMEEKATVIELEKADLAGGRANLRVSAMGNAVLSEDSPALDPAKLAGVTGEAAVEYLEQVKGVASASVRLSPFWAVRLPTVADNIRVEVR